ncbi:MAG: hypothetical protein PHE79_07895 [Eubacteriales bacterium]|nr:hypothetical protein [Eubacteriales bacterium]
MYDFLFSEEFWMETIIAAAITAGCGLLGVALGVFGIRDGKFKDILHKVETVITSLARDKSASAGEHGSLSKEHDSLSIEHKSLSGQIVDASKMAGNIYTEIKVMQERDIHKYSSLTEKQKDIVASVDNIKAMADELKRLAGENADLRQELYRERERNQDMQNRLDRKPRARGHER